jgi:hypothetical protein
MKSVILICPLLPKIRDNVRILISGRNYLI